MLQFLSLYFYLSFRLSSFHSFPNLFLLSLSLSRSLYHSLVLSIALTFLRVALSTSKYDGLEDPLYYLYHCTKGQCQEKTIRKVTIHNILILFVEKYFNCDLFHLRNRHKGANLHCLNKLAVEIEKNHHFQYFSTKHFFVYIPISYSKGLKWQFWPWNE